MGGGRVEAPMVISGTIVLMECAHSKKLMNTTLDQVLLSFGTHSPQITGKATSLTVHPAQHQKNTPKTFPFSGNKSSWLKSPQNPLFLESVIFLAPNTRQSPPKRRENLWISARNGAKSKSFWILPPKKQKYCNHFSNDKGFRLRLIRDIWKLLDT